MTRPIIGITTNLGDKGAELARPYWQSVRAAGGVPVLLPPTDDVEEQEAVLEQLDGIVFSGGADLNPVLVGEDPVPELHGINPDRDEYELRICRRAHDRQIPILGICRGAQIMAAALGGAVAGAFCGTMSAHNRAERVFFWVEGLALGLTACVFADMAFGGASLWDNRDTPAIMALLAGLFCSLAPGFVRDVALGDTAGFVDESWYATAAALGIMLTLALRHFLPDVPTPLVEPPVAGGNRILLRHGPVLGGALLVLLLRFTMRGRGIH